MPDELSPATESNLDESNRQIQRLYEITLQINRGQSLTDVLNKMYDTFYDIIPYDRIGLSLIEEDGETVRAVWGKSSSPTVRLKPGYSAPLTGSSLQRIIETGQPRILNDLEAYLNNKPDSKSTRLIVAEGLRASLTCPLIIEGTPVGFLFFSSAEPGIYSEQHITLFQLIAGQIAVIVDRFRLLTGLRTKAEALERRAREMETFNQIMLDITAELDDLDTVLNRIAHHARDLLSCSVIVIMLHRPERDVLKVANLTGETQNFSGSDIRRGEGLSGRVWETGQPLKVDNYHTWEGRLPRHEQDPISAVLVVPIIWGETFLGVINAALLGKTQRTFSDYDQHLLSWLAGQAAIAIHNAQIFADLEARNRELDAFSHTVAHDLKAPLTYLVGYTNLLLDDPEWQPSDEVRMMLAEIDRSARKMDQIIKSLLLLAHLRQEQQPPYAVVDMNTLLQDVVERFSRELKAQQVALGLAGDYPAVYGYAPWVEAVFANLLSNAIKYIGKDNPHPLISISGEQNGEYVHYTVADNGSGIEAGDLQHLFGEFTRFHTDQSEGHGLGLSIVKRLVDRMDGTISVTSEPGQGSTFQITFPAPPEDSTAG